MTCYVCPQPVGHSVPLVYNVTDVEHEAVVFSVVVDGGYETFLDVDSSTGVITLARTMDYEDITHPTTFNIGNCCTDRSL